MKTLNTLQLEAYERVVVNNAPITFITAAAGCGKALANSEVVLTTNGFVPMKDVTTDTLVIDSKGNPTQVLAVYPQGIRAIYKVTFKDGTSVMCDGDHKWTVRRMKASAYTEILTTTEILQDDYATKRFDKRYNTYQNTYKYGIPFSSPCNYGVDNNLPIDPYLLGLLLGDGGFTESNKISFTNKNLSIIEEVKARLPEGCQVGYETYKQGAYHINIKRKQGTKVNSLLEAIKDLGLHGHKSTAKFIPNIYKNGSLETRQAIIKGLIDTDGHVRNGRLIEYSTSSKQLADDFIHLGRSIGMYLTMHSRQSSYTKNGIRHLCSTSYRISSLKAKSKAIVSIEYSHDEEATCITVESPDHLFVTAGFNLTHNSYLAGKILEQYPDAALIASTHKAKSILSQMAQRPAATVHSYLGYKIQAVNYKQELVGGNKKIDPVHLVVLDEVSMCPNKLLTDLTNLVELGIIKQLVILGDAIQLKAVSNPPNLQALIPYQVELTQQMRQDSCPILAEYFDSLRTAIENTQMPALFADVPAITFIDSHKEFCEIYNKCNTNKKIIAYRNSVVDKYNSFIHDGDTFNIGDDVIIDKPLGTAKNQDIVKIVQITDTERRYEIIVTTAMGQSFLIYHYKQSTKLAEELQFFKDQDNPDAYWELHNISFRLKHAYASTVHKCQGESYDVVFLDAADFTSAYQTPRSKWNNPITLDTFLRLYYVAISRMQSHAYVYTGGDGKGRSYEKLKPKTKRN